MHFQSQTIRRIVNDRIAETREEFWERHRRNAVGVDAAPRLGKLFRNN